MAKMIGESKEQTFRLTIGIRPLFTIEPELYATEEEVTNFIHVWLTTRALKERGRPQFSGNVYYAQHCRAWPDTDLAAGSGENFPVVCFEGQVPQYYLEHKNTEDVINYIVDLGEFLAKNLCQRFFQIGFGGTFQMYEADSFAERLEKAQ